MKQDSDRARSLGESIQQGKPFTSIFEEGLLTLLLTESRLAECIAEPLRQKGLTIAQYNILRILRGSKDGLLMHEAAERMVSRATSITRLVDRLETCGWLTRVRCTKDRRAIHLRLTEAGSEILGKLESPMAEVVRDATRGLTAPEMKTLCRLLNQLRFPLENHHLANSAKNQSGRESSK